jgi:ribonuclease inhibitor
MTMRKAIIDGELMIDREALHDALARQLDLPDWYGRNLDALFDCLTDIHEDATIVLRDLTALEQHLGNYVGNLLRVLCQAAAENPHLKIIEE